MQARRGGECRVCGFGTVWGTNARMPSRPASARKCREYGSPVSDSGAAMEGHATESINFNGILVDVLLTQSSKNTEVDAE
jgi:hypothetical protein